MLLLSNLLAVASVSWITGPIVRRILKSWMTARPADLRITVFGTLVIVVSLFLLLGVFLQVPVT